MRNLISLLYTKTFYCFLTIALQILAIVFLCVFVPATLPYCLSAVGIWLANVLLVFCIANDGMPQPHKIGYLMLALALPVAGVLLYFCARQTKQTEHPCVHLSTYQTATYYADGKAYLNALLHAMEQARISVYLEYYIWDKGVYLNRLLKLIPTLTARGVEVKMLCDGLGCAFRFPRRLVKKCKQAGAEVKVFRPIVPLLSLRANSRNHRKLAVIDGTVAFTGGVNFADEYANVKTLYGHWKDTGVSVQGEMAATLAQSFLAMWQRQPYTQQPEKTTANFGVQSPAGTALNRPLDRQECLFFYDYPPRFGGTGATVLGSAIARAKRRIWVFTPYFCPDENTLKLLCFAAFRGVNVRIILPKIPDKRTIYTLSRAFSTLKIAQNIQFFAYFSGFLHAKNYLIDDDFYIGSYNLDCRSFYTNAECGLRFSGGTVVKEAEKDFLNTLALCEPMPPLPRRTAIFAKLLRPFAPLF